MRRYPLLIVILLLMASILSACGGDGDTVETIPATLPTTTTTAPTTTTTTTTLPPIPSIGVEAIAMPQPILTEDRGGPVIVETYCEEEYSTLGDGTIIVDPTQQVMFEFMGVKHSRNDCDVVIDDFLEAERYSATYTGVGQCFTGWTIVGEMVARVGDQRWIWDVEVDREPPMSINGCAKDEEPPGGSVPFGARVAPFRKPFEALFGPLGLVSFASGALGVIPIDDEPPDPAVYDILAAAMYLDDLDQRCTAISMIHNLAWDLQNLSHMTDTPRDPGIDTVVPHLITTSAELADLLDEADYDEGRCLDRIDAALMEITGLDLEGPRAWSEWWLAEHPEG